MRMGGIRSRSTHLYSTVKSHTHDRGFCAAYLQHLSQETPGPCACSPEMPYGAASIRIIGPGGPKCPVRPPSTFYLLDACSSGFAQCREHRCGGVLPAQRRNVPHYRCLIEAT